MVFGRRKRTEQTRKFVTEGYSGINKMPKARVGLTAIFSSTPEVIRNGERMLPFRNYYVGKTMSKLGVYSHRPKLGDRQFE